MVDAEPWSLQSTSFEQAHAQSAVFQLQGQGDPCGAGTGDADIKLQTRSVFPPDSANPT